MDPATALQLAGTALAAAQKGWDVGVSLYQFCKDSKKLDRTMTAFAGEVKALATACEFVSDRLQDIVRTHEGVIKWRGQQILACKETVNELRQAIGNVHATEDSNLAEKAWNQIKLNMKAPDVESARNRIRSHTSSVQTVLICIGIEISYVAPQRADQQLQSVLVKLGEKTAELDQLLKQNPVGDACRSENAILKASSAVLADGETLYEGSVAGGSSVGAWDSDNIVAVVGWLHGTDGIGRVGSQRSNAASSTLPASRYPGSFTENTTPAPRVTHSLQSKRFSTLVELLYDDSDDSDDDWRLEAAKHLVATGLQAFNEARYKEANKPLLNARKIATELSVRQRGIADTPDVKYMLAVCAFHLSDAATAGTQLLQFIDSTMHDEARRVQVCNVGHLLSQTCVKLGNLEDARRYCESARKGRRRLLGKSDKATYESTALMARILALQGDTDSANFLSGMIPSPYDELRDAFAHLGVEDTGRGESPEEAVPGHEDPNFISVPATRPASTDSVVDPSGGVSNSIQANEWASRAGTASSISTSDAVSPQNAEQPWVKLDEDYPNNQAETASVTSSHASLLGRLRSHVRLPFEQSALLEGHRRTRPPHRLAPEDYFGPHIRRHVIDTDYATPKVLSQSERARLCAAKQWQPTTEVAKALMDCRDDDAVRIVRTNGNSIKHVQGQQADINIAAAFGAFDVVHALLPFTPKEVLCKKSIFNTEAGWSTSPLGDAAEGGFVEVAALLIKAGADVNGSPLQRAVESKSYGVADLLLEHGSDPLIELYYTNLGTPLHIACRMNELVLIRALDGIKSCITHSKLSEIVIGMSVHIKLAPKGRFGSPKQLWILRIDPFGWAAYSGSYDAVQYLLWKGASVDSSYSAGTMPLGVPMVTSALSLAAARGFHDIVRLLIQNFPASRWREDAFQCAVVNHRDEAACVLLEAGAGKIRFTHKWAAKMGMPRLAAKLLQTK